MLLGPIKAKLAPQELAKKPDDLYKAKLLYGALTTIAAVGTLFAARSRRTLLAVASGALTAIGLSVLQRLFSFVPDERHPPSTDTLSLEERFRAIKRQIEQTIPPNATLRCDSLPVTFPPDMNPGDQLALTVKKANDYADSDPKLVMCLIVTKEDDHSALLEVLPLDKDSATYATAVEALINIQEVQKVTFAPNEDLTKALYKSFIFRTAPREMSLDEALTRLTNILQGQGPRDVWKQRLCTLLRVEVTVRKKPLNLIFDQFLAAPHLCNSQEYINIFTLDIFDQQRYQKLTFDFSPGAGEKCTRDNFKSDVNYREIVSQAINAFVALD